jgi:hypothetical protein
MSILEKILIRDFGCLRFGPDFALTLGDAHRKIRGSF